MYQAAAVAVAVAVTMHVKPGMSDWMNHYMECQIQHTVYMQVLVPHYAGRFYH